MSLPSTQPRDAATVDRASADPFDLDRFVRAQEPVVADVMAELGRGSKQSHWMWFVFPQLVGLGTSPMARRYGIGSRAEALAYLAHPTLGERLRACTRLVLAALPGRTLVQIFGTPDHLKFFSSMSLFHTVAPEDAPFADALRLCWEGRADPATLERLRP